MFTPGRREAIHRAKRLMAENGPSICQRYMAGENLDPIAKEYGVTLQTISLTVQRHGGEIRKQRRGEYRYGPDNPSWRGGTFTKDGYRLVRLLPDDPYRAMSQSKGYVPEHRIVMARAIGRMLFPDETVHHINGDGLDNRIENLQLRVGRHGKGVALACHDCGSQNVGPIPLGGQDGNRHR